MVPIVKMAVSVGSGPIQLKVKVIIYHNILTTELKIREGIEDNSKVVFLISQQKRMF